MSGTVLLPFFLATVAAGGPKTALVRALAWPWAALRWHMGIAKGASA